MLANEVCDCVTRGENNNYIMYGNNNTFCHYMADSQVIVVMGHYNKELLWLNYMNTLDFSTNEGSNLKLLSNKISISKSK